jgi:HD-GYP domain-containing protein (c-di-GMP phosphodiesterase class II)
MENERAWHSRPGVARTLRIAIVVAPIIMTIVAITLLARRVPPPSGLPLTIGWWVGLSVVATLLLAMLDKLFRKLLPVVALFKISLVFPDSAPSRFSTALRAGTVKQLKRKMQDGELAASTPQEAAEHLIGIANALNAHDRMTRGHTERVRAYSVMIGEEMGLDEHDIELLNWSGLIHDVGKLTVPTEILNSPDKPTDEEWHVLREHPVHGSELIDPLRGFLGEFAESATQHHERYDGTGYPNGLAGTEITLAGRIVAVADAYDVMTSTRSYKKPMPPEEARKELAVNSGTQFDPEVVRAFLSIALGRVRLVAGPLASLAQIPFLSAGATAGSAAATGAGAAATVAVATVTGLVDVTPAAEPVVEEIPAAVALVDIEAPELNFGVREDEQFELDLQTAVGKVGARITLLDQPVGATAELDENGQLTLIPGTDVNGLIVTPYRICVDDTCTEAALNLSVQAVNDEPTPVPDTLVMEAGETARIDVVANDVDLDGDLLTVASLFDTRGGTARIVDNVVEFVADDEAVDGAGFSYTIVDDGGAAVSTRVSVTVIVPEIPPELTRDEATTLEDEPVRIQPLDNDVSTQSPFDVNTLTVAWRPANGAVQVDDTDLVYTPEDDWNGNTSFAYRICNTDGLCSTGAIDVTVLQVNDAPTVQVTGGLVVNEDAGPQSLRRWATAISAGAANETGQNLTIDVQTSTPSLFAVQPSVDAAGTLTFTPAANANGSATLAVTISDNGGSANGGDSSTSVASSVTVLAVNDAPSFEAGANLAVPEDSGARTYENWATDIAAGPTNEAAQTTRLVIDVDRPELFDVAPALSADGTLTFTATDDANGETIISVKIDDDAGTLRGGTDTSTVQERKLSILSVNDAPSFVIGDDVTVVEDSGSQEIVGWATSISPGPNEDGQSVNFVVTTTNAALFAALPVVSPDGTLTFTPADDANGSARFTVTLVDDGGDELGGTDRTNSTAGITVTAVNGTPVAVDDFGMGYATTEDTSFTTSDITANDLDEEGPVDSTTVLVISSVRDGVLTNNGDGTFGYAPNPNFFGTDSFTYLVSDSDGVRSTPATVTIEVVAENDAPVAIADFGAGYETNEDTPFTTADVTANDFDFDGTIDPGSVQIVATTTGGTLTNNGDGTFEYEPVADFAGTDAFSYRIADAAGLDSNVTTVNLVVNAVNDPPVAVNDGLDGSIRTTEDTPFVTPNVLANDYDVDHTVEPTSLGVSISAANGSLTYNGDGTFNYSPDPDFVGQENIQYTIQDLDGERSEQAILRIFVDAENDKPVAVADSGIGFTTSEGQLLTTIDVTDNDTDVDSPVVPSSAVATSTPNDGTLLNNGDGTFDYQPDALFNGTDTFSYTITDADGAVSDPVAVTLTVTAVNDKPVATDDSGIGFEGTEGTSFTTGDVTANDTDPEDVTVDPATVVVVDNVSSGKLDNNGDGTFEYEPDADSNGTDTFTYRVADSGGLLSDPATVTLTIAAVNDAPSFTRGPNLTMIQDVGSIAYAAWATDIESGPANESGQSVTFSVVPDDAAFFDVQPTIDATGELVMTVADGVSGGTFLTITAVDDGGTANGGSDTSAAVVLDILVSPEDFDGVDQADDNAPGLFNPLQIDTDGDGVGDIADATPTAAGSTGIFAYAFETDEGVKATDGLAADWDGDGRLDLALSTEDEGTYVWLNSPVGLDLPDPLIIDSDDEVKALASADLNGDGDLDLVMGQVGGGNETWINDGTGSFSLGTTLGAFDTHGVALGDVDGDGDIDMVAANTQDNNTVRLNDGNGNFTLDSVFGSTSAKDRAIVMDDLDGDFDLDIIIGTEGGPNTVWFNDGTGTFVDSGQALGTNEKTRELALADFDRDGDVDLVVAEDNDPDTYWVNDGSGTFTDSGQSLGRANTHSVAVGDVDGDGDIDIVFGDDNSESSVWLNDGNEVFTDSGQDITADGKTESIVLADFTGEGALDIVTIRDDQNSQLYLGGIN